MRLANKRDSIVAAALGLFAERGIDSTSLREVATSADVSPALIVHHFGGKEGLVDAVDRAALEEFGTAYAKGEEATGPDLLRIRSRQTVRVMRECPEACSYLGRALVEGTPGSSRLFRLIIEGGQAEIEALAAKGALRENADRLWATLQHFFLIWAPLSFLPLLEEVLGGPLLDDAALERWADANVELLEKGIYG